MYEDINSILQKMGTATDHCQDLCATERLTTERRSRFCRLSEYTLNLSVQISNERKKMDACLKLLPDKKAELNEDWDGANGALEDFKRNITVPEKEETAVKKTTDANEHTSSFTYHCLRPTNEAQGNTSST